MTGVSLSRVITHSSLARKELRTRAKTPLTGKQTIQNASSREAPDGAATPNSDIVTINEPLQQTTTIDGREARGNLREFGLWLEEAYALKRMETIKRSAAYMRGLGGKLITIWQNRNQIIETSVRPDKEASIRCVACENGLPVQRAAILERGVEFLRFRPSRPSRPVAVPAHQRVVHRRPFSVQPFVGSMPFILRPSTWHGEYVALEGYVNSAID